MYCRYHLFFFLTHLSIYFISRKNKIASSSAMSKESSPVLFLRWFIRMLNKMHECIFVLKKCCMHPLHSSLLCIMKVLLMKPMDNENDRQILHFCTSMLGSQKENRKILHCRTAMPEKNSHLFILQITTLKFKVNMSQLC